MSEKLAFLNPIGPGLAILGIGGIWAWYRLEKIKLEKGYPIENIWGKPMHPKSADEQVISLQADLERKTAQISRLEEHVATLERILTDRSTLLAAEIDQLRR